MSDTPDCRILTISNSLENAFRFVDYVKGHPEAPQSSQPTRDRSIPWTISNKYYTADVNFEVRHVGEYRSDLAQNVPAVVFVWTRGETYKDNVQRLAHALDTRNREVCLGVRMMTRTTTSISQEVEDEDDTDDYLSTHGFEFVEVYDPPTFRPSADSHDADHDIRDNGVPGLPRVIDALSTIMWPSMVQAKSSTRARKGHLDWARDESEVDMDVDVDVDELVEVGGQGEKERHLHREMEDLERWLTEDGDEADPWKMATRSETPPTSAPTIHQDDGGKTGRSGFDDDFTVFVSAPAQSSPSPDTSFDSDLDTGADRLFPMHTGASYASLGSVSDFGDQETHETHEEDDDPDLPSRAEIADATRHLFGSTSPLSRTSTARGGASSSITPTASTFAASALSPANGDDDSGVAAFDLSRVLGALQGMKEEIAGMTDEGERRRAAARVALGLVYGLEGEGDVQEV